MEISVSSSGEWRGWINRMLRVSEKTEEICKRLCEVGQTIVKQTHHQGGTMVWYEKTQDGYKIVAQGEDVMFIEFGTGDRAGELIAWYDQVPTYVRPGSWSEAHEGEYAATGGEGVGYWHFGGREYHETEPHPAFFEAYRAMVEALPQIAQEVFSK